MTSIDLAHLTENALTDGKMAQKKPLILSSRAFSIRFSMVLCSSDTFDRYFADIIQ